MPNTGQFTSTIASAEKLPVLANAKGLILDHVSGGDVWCAFGETAVVGQGFRLGPNRPAVIIQGQLDDLLLALNVISATGQLGVVSYHRLTGPVVLLQDVADTVWNTTLP